MSKVEIHNCDCLDWTRQQPADSVDMVFGSPPYEAARTYGIDFKLKGQAWVDWAVERFLDQYRICKGLTCWVIEGQTKDFRWSATPALFMADLHRAGVRLRKPPIFYRSGIPGSGGPDWWRNDYEFCVCGSKGKLPWSDNTATGHAPKWPAGGKLSYRDANGVRRHKIRGTSGYSAGDARDFRASEGNLLDRAVTEIANPGNVIKCNNGGGQLGDHRAHENEAPFSEQLVEPFVLSFCPPDGLVYDPFSGSGTTAAVALRHGRNFVGTDIRESQVALTKRRIKEVQPVMF
jgi:hypothetical protein